MKALLTGVAAALLAATPAATYQIDLARYFPSAAAEAQSRAAVLADATAFVSSATPTAALGLLRWLQRYDGLLARIERHDIYVYLKAEEDDRDNADAKADDALGNAEDLVSNRVVEGAQRLGEARIAALTRAPQLAPYRYLLSQALAQSAHRLTAAEARSVALAVTPVLDAAAASYKALRKSDTSIESNQDAYAALLVSIASARNGLARPRGFFRERPRRRHFDRSIAPASVERTLHAVRDSTAYEALSCGRCRKRSRI